MGKVINENNCRANDLRAYMEKYNLINKYIDRLVFKEKEKEIIKAFASGKKYTEISKELKISETRAREIVLWFMYKCSNMEGMDFSKKGL